MRDALGLTLDRVYWWRLLLEEYGPEIVYIKGIHNTVADAISRLEYDPNVNKTAESYLMTKVKGNSRSVQKTKQVDTFKTLVQWRNRRHHQTWRFESRVCYSRRRGQNLPSHNNRDSKSTKRKIEILRSIISEMQRHQKRECVFNLLKTPKCFVRLIN